MADAAKIRMSLDLPNQVYDDLERYATQIGTTKSDIMRKAIGLIGLAVDAKVKNQKLGIFDQDRQLVTEIVGL